MLQLTIHTDNAAFEGTPASEIARILRHAADRIEADDWTGIGPDGNPTLLLRDANGNRVGAAALVPDEE